MRVLALLIVVLVITVIALALYAMRLRRTIRESENPLLSLTRKQRAMYAHEELEHIRNMRNLDWQDKLEKKIMTPLPFRKDNR